VARNDSCNQVDTTKFVESIPSSISKQPLCARDILRWNAPIRKVLCFQNRPNDSFDEQPGQASAFIRTSLLAVSCRLPACTLGPALTQQRLLPFPHIAVSIPPA
jgi:hypothetical protein